MMKKTCADWLVYLDQMDPPDVAWRDPDFTSAVSWVMVSFMWRRLNQRLIDAGYAHDIRQHGFKVKSPRAPWAIRDKYAAVRLFIRDAQNRRRLKIDPSGKRLIRSLASLEYALGKAVADPKSDHGHMSDALGYMCLGIAKGLLPYSLGTTSFQMY